MAVNEAPAFDEFAGEPIEDEFAGEVLKAPTKTPAVVTAPADKIGPTGAFVSRAGQALTAGLTEPVSAGISALIGEKPGAPVASLAERYEFFRTLGKERQARVEEEQPTAATAGTVFGTLLGLATPATRLAKAAQTEARLAELGAKGGELAGRTVGGLAGGAGRLAERGLSFAGAPGAGGAARATGEFVERVAPVLGKGAGAGALPAATFAAATEGAEQAGEGAKIGGALGAGGAAVGSLVRKGLGVAAGKVGMPGAALEEEGKGLMERARRESLLDIKEPAQKLEQKIADIADRQKLASEKAANRSAQIQVKTEDQIERLAAALPDERAAELKSLNEQLAKVNADLEGLDRSARAASAQLHQELFTRLSNYLDFASRNNEPVPPEFLQQYKYLGASLGQWTGPKLESLQRYMTDRQAWFDDYTAGKRVPLEAQQRSLAERIAAAEGLPPEDALAKAREIITARNKPALSPERIRAIYGEKGLDLPIADAGRYTFKEPGIAGFTGERAKTTYEQAAARARREFEKTRTPEALTGKFPKPTPEELAEFARRQVEARRSVRGLPGGDVGDVAGIQPTEIGRRATYGGLLAREGVGITPRIPGVPSVRGLLLGNVAIDPVGAADVLAISPKTNRFTNPDEAYALLREFEGVISKDRELMDKVGPLVSRMGTAAGLRFLLRSPEGQQAIQDASERQAQSAP